MHGTLRIVATSAAGRAAGETFPIGPEPVTIGRSDGCTIVLQDTAVSRRHAVVEAGPRGVQLRDAGSANGVFLGTVRATDALLESGTQFQVGDTLFEYVAPDAAPAGTFVLRIVRSKVPGQEGAEFTVTGRATIGRGEDCTVVLKDGSASRRHAAVDMDGTRFRVTDTGSANGVWLEDRRITETLVDQGQRFRVGDSFFECAPPRDEAESDQTMVMADVEALLAKVAARRLAEVGETVSISGGRAVLLNDPSTVYFVDAGSVEVFTVAVKEGRPTGARSHFLSVPQGEALFGMDLREAGDSSFLASAKGDAVVRRVPRAEIAALRHDPDAASEASRLVDAWVTRLSRRLTDDIRQRGGEQPLEPGAALHVPHGQRVRAGAGVLWCDLDPDTWLYVGMDTLAGDDGARTCPFPLTPHSWIETVSDPSAPLVVTGRRTDALLDDPAPDALWTGLDAFHRALANCEFINKRLSIVDEFARLDQKARQSDAARDAAMDAIGSVLAGKVESVEMAPVGSVKPLLEACRLVATHLGLKVNPPGESRVERTLNEQVLAIAAASRFRSRQVVLRGDWYRYDHGPMLGVLAETNSPVALLPRGPQAYDIAEPSTGMRRPLTPDLAFALQPFAHSFYRPLPAGRLTARQLLAFGARGLAPDFRWLGMMGIATGALGAVTPYLTGRMVDNAIPQADRSLLLQLGGAMLLTALVNISFKIVQSIAVVRIESRLDYVLAAAIWDRLLDLPSGFFRQFGAGDLAERAGGINAIRGVVSRAGVGGILGGISSVGYVVLMLTYSVQMTLVAIVIALVLVSVTTLGNYRQLQYQRNESTQRGRIMSLVLQLVTGVAKVRVCAAEFHAFRVWAQQFSQQKQTGFSIGQVQNVVGTFTAGFSVLSSMAIFGTLASVQSSGEGQGFTTGAFIAFNGAYGAFVAALQALSDASMSLLKAVPTFERLRPILDTEPESDETKVTPGKLSGAITVSHLHFRYNPDSPWIIKDVSFSIKPGEMVAFVGSSGCGKSTLLRLLLGFERPQSGSVAYDGQDLSTLDIRAVRQQLGVVLQESRVLPTDIFRNIVGATAHTMDDAWEAVRMAGLADDIKEMPMGMHTIVSEGGGTFSGGQRQRLLIARALVNRPRIIFFDEATSALDNKAQATVTESMDRLDATRIVIAHRLSTIVNADRIFYFDAGQIREEGTYHELLAKGGLFAAMARRQLA